MRATGGLGIAMALLIALTPSCSGNGDDTTTLHDALEWVSPEGMSTGVVELSSGREYPGMLSFVDLDAAAAATDVPAPADEADVVEFVQFFEAVRRFGWYPDFVGEGVPEMRDRFGFGAADLDVWVTVRPGKFDALDIVGANFDTDDVTAALDDHSAAAETTDIGGLEAWIWPGREKLPDIERIKDGVDATAPFRPPYFPLRVTVDDEHLVVARTRAALETAIEAHTSGTSINEDPALGPIIDTLEAERVIAGTIVDAPRTLDDIAVRSPATAEKFAAEPTLRPYAAFAIGASQEHVIVVLAHADEHAAAENAERVATVVAQGQQLDAAQQLRSVGPWSDLFTDVDISVHGNLVVARLTTDRPSVWSGLKDLQSNLLVSSD